MAGLRIRWRRQSSELSAAAVVPRNETSSRATLDVFILVALALIVLAGFTARAYNVNWDENNHLHPDERFLSFVANDIDLPRSIGEYFDGDRSRLNPYNQTSVHSFVHGTVPLFLTKTVAVLAGADNYDELTLTGRYLSGLFSTGTIILVFLIGRRLYGPMAGLLGAFLMATAPLAIQHAHFFVVDPFLTFFTTALLYFSLRIVQEGKRADYAFAGLMLGLGLACKVTALLFLPVIVAAVGLRLWLMWQATEVAVPGP